MVAVWIWQTYVFSVEIMSGSDDKYVSRVAQRSFRHYCNHESRLTTLLHEENNNNVHEGIGNFVHVVVGKLQYQRIMYHRQKPEQKNQKKLFLDTFSYLSSRLH